MSESCIALLATTPATVFDDHARLLKLVLPAHLITDRIPLISLATSVRHPLPGAGATPWQFEATIRALRGTGLQRIALSDSTHSFYDEPMVGERMFKEGFVLPDIFRTITLHAMAAAHDAAGFMPIAAAYALEQRHLTADPLAPDSLVPSGHLPFILAPCDPMLLLGAALQPTAHNAQFRSERHPQPDRIFLVDATTVIAPFGARLLEMRNLLLAGVDRVALAAVAARLLGLDPQRLPALQIAASHGLGCADLTAIDIVGEPALLDTAPPLSSKPTYGAFTALLPPAVRRFIQHYYYWPQRDRPLFDDWSRHTSWGRLFQRYQRATLS